LASLNQRRFAVTVDRDVARQTEWNRRTAVVCVARVNFTELSSNHLSQVQCRVLRRSFRLCGDHRSLANLMISIICEGGKSAGTTAVSKDRSRLAAGIRHLTEGCRTNNDAETTERFRTAARVRLRLRHRLRGPSVDK
jgi:hypothetical protein